jgi:hypothetical protein
MADDIKNLIFKITIDGKEIGIPLKSIQKGIEEITQASQVADKSYQTLSASAMEFNSATLSNVKAIEEVITKHQLNETHVRQATEALREQQAMYTVGSEAYTRHQAAITNIITAYQNLSHRGRELENQVEKITQANLVADNSYQALSAAALKFDAATFSNAKSIEEVITKYKLNETHIRQATEALREQMAMYTVGSEAYNRHQAAIVNITKAYQGLSSGLAPVIYDANAAKMMMMQFGYALGDASMFAVDARMAIMGMANNFPFVVQHADALRRSLAGTGQTMWNIVRNQIRGPMGLIIGANLLTVAIMAVPKVLELFDNKAQDTEITLDKLTEATGRLSDGFSNVQKEIDNLSFDGLSEKYNALISSMNESENELKKDSLVKQIWQGLTFKPLTNALGISDNWFIQSAQSVPWPLSLFEGSDSDTKKKLDDQERAKKQIEDTGNKIKNFMQAGYTASSLLSIAPKDRDSMSKYIKDILNDWAENVDQKSLSIGDKLRGTFVDLGTYSRQSIVDLQKAISEVDPDKKKKTPSTRDDATSLANQVSKAEEYNGKLRELSILLQANTSQYEKDRLVLQVNYDSAVKGIDAEIAALEKKKKQQESDRQRIKNLNAEKEIEQKQYLVNLLTLEKKHNLELLESQQDFIESRMKLENSMESEIIQSRIDFYTRLRAIELDQEERDKLNQKIILLEKEKQNAVTKQQLDLAQLRAESYRDEYKQQLTDLDVWRREMQEKYKGHNEYLQLIERQYKNKRNDILREEYQEKSQTSMAFIDATTAGFGTMWDQLIIGGRQAKDPWDAIWLSFRNTALSRIGEILSSGLFEEILSIFSGTTSKKASGASSSGGSFWDVIGSVIPIFTLLKPAVNTGAGTVAVSSDAAIAKTVVDRIDKWQKQLVVRNDIWDANEKIKTVNNLLDKYSI